MVKMGKKRAFISFDYDNDEDLKNLLVGQARNSDSPFEITDLSIKEAIPVGWKNDARRRIKSCDVVIVICGKKTNTAKGVDSELRIAQEESIPYFLLYGRAEELCVKPSVARATDRIYRWTWNNLKQLIGGAR